jgi:hypothetical protein
MLGPEMDGSSMSLSPASCTSVVAPVPASRSAMNSRSDMLVVTETQISPSHGWLQPDASPTKSRPRISLAYVVIRLHAPALACDTRSARDAMAGGWLAGAAPAPHAPHADEEDVKGVEEDQGGNAESDAAALKAVIEETDRNISG